MPPVWRVGRVYLPARMARMSGVRLGPARGMGPERPRGGHVLSVSTFRLTTRRLTIHASPMTNPSIQEAVRDMVAKRRDKQRAGDVAPGGEQDPILEWRVVERPSGTRFKWRVDPYVQKLGELVETNKAAHVRARSQADLDRWLLAIRQLMRREHGPRIRVKKVADAELLVWAEKGDK